MYNTLARNTSLLYGGSKSGHVYFYFLEVDQTTKRTFPGHVHDEFSRYSTQSQSPSPRALDMAHTVPESPSATHPYRPLPPIHPIVLPNDSHLAAEHRSTVSLFALIRAIVPPGSLKEFRYP
jgi:hypothetical protein